MAAVSEPLQISRRPLSLRHHHVRKRAGESVIVSTSDLPVATDEHDAETGYNFVKANATDLPTAVQCRHVEPPADAPRDLWAQA